MKPVRVVETGSLGRSWLTVLRDERTRPDDFRRYLKNLTAPLVLTALADVSTKSVWINTPVIHSVQGTRLAKPVHVAVILRAALGMVDAIQEMITNVFVWHIDMYRDEATHEPVWVRAHLPTDCGGKVWLIPDPMLATGGSVIKTIAELVTRGAVLEDIRVVCVIAAPEGIQAVERAFDARIRIFTAEVDQKLNRDAYIVPGLGDAGDRQFGTGVQSTTPAGGQRIPVFKSEH